MQWLEPNRSALESALPEHLLECESHPAKQTGGKLTSFPWLQILGLEVAPELEKGCANGLSNYLTFAGLFLGTM